MGYREAILATPNLDLYARFGESNVNAGVVAEYGPSGIFPTTRPDLNSAGALVGDPNTCFRWSASNSDYIYWPGNLFTYGGTSHFSIEIWYQPTTLAPTTTFMNLVSKDRYDAYSSGYGLYLNNSNERLYFARVPSSGNADVLAGPIVSMGTWYHIVCTYNGATMAMYINGSLVSSAGSWLSVGTHTGTPLYLGRSAQWEGEYLSAWMDEFALYHRALSAAEVQTHYNTGINPVTPEYGGSNLTTRFTTSVAPTRFRSGSGDFPMNSAATFFVQREVKAYHSFPSTLPMQAEGNVSAFPSHFLSVTSGMTVTPIRKKTSGASMPTKTDVLVRMPMKFLESHAFNQTFKVAPKSKVTYKSNKPRFPMSFKVNASGMTRIELDDLFARVADVRTGAIHFVVERLSTEELTNEHAHMSTLDEKTITPFIARNSEGKPRIIGTASVEWYISRVVIDATTRVHDRPDLMEYFGETEEVTG